MDEPPEKHDRSVGHELAVMLPILSRDDRPWRDCRVAGGGGWSHAHRGFSSAIRRYEMLLKNRIEARIRKKDNTFRNSFRVDPLRKKSYEDSQRSAKYQVPR
jgi:hypothetical protein